MPCCRVFGFDTRCFTVSLIYCADDTRLLRRPRLLPPRYAGRAGPGRRVVGYALLLRSLYLSRIRSPRVLPLDDAISTLATLFRFPSLDFFGQCPSGVILCFRLPRMPTRFIHGDSRL